MQALYLRVKLDPARIDYNDTVNVDVELENSAGTGLNPTTVKFKTFSPSGSAKTYTYGTDSEVTYSSLGKYSLAFVASEPGAWRVRVETISPSGAKEICIDVHASPFYSSIRDY